VSKNKFVPLHVHSHYSLLDGLSKPTQIAERCTELGYTHCALTDHGSISGSIQFIKALKDCCKCGHQKGIHEDNGQQCRMRGCPCSAFDKGCIKPILGSEFYLCPKHATIKEQHNRKASHLVILAKNLQGWRSLIQAVSAANKPEHVWYKKPRLNLEQLAEFAKGNFVAFSGHLGSDLADICFAEPRLAYSAKTYEEAKSLVRPDWKEKVLGLAGKYNELFGKGNFYLEKHRLDHKNLPASDIVSKILDWASPKLNIPCVATCDAHYPRQEDAQDQRISLCSQFKTTLSTVQRKIALDEDVTLGAFFKSNNYHIPSTEEMEALYDEKDLRATLEIADKCESYDVLGKPILPNFECPNNLDNNSYLKALCDAGWSTKVEPVIKDAESKTVYTERLNQELKVFFEAGLSGYFLVVQDYVDFAKRQGWLVGPGRGSGAGCLVSHLIGITSIDPIEYGLIFERFYNAGRNTKDRISFPDIDCDFPRMHRDKVFDYISNKYGTDKVSQMITFGRMQGKSAIKDVLHAHEKLSFTERNAISSAIPADSEIADKLQEMAQETGESSIIRWALENNKKALKEWCYINEDGELDGEYSKLFEQAIRMEGTKRSQGKHASGVVMAPIPLAEVCPMVYDKSEDTVVAGFEMNDLEAIGLIKFDVLGVAVLDKMMGVANLLENGVVV
jgi:DNA polymerase-3 subunit alpha